MRIPPQSVEAEKHVLGAMMLSPDAAAHAVAVLAPEDFYLQAHGMLFAAVSRLVAERSACDVVTVCEELRRTGRLDDVGEARLLDIAREVVTSASVEEHSRIVLDRSRKRAIIRAGEWVLESAYSGQGAKEIQEELERRVFALHEKGATEKTLQHISVVLMESFRVMELRAKGDVVGIPTGLAALDGHTGGLQAGDLVVIGGRPGQGKTALCGQIGVSAAKIGKKVAFFECEMTDRAVVDRVLFAEAGLSLHLLRSGRLPRAEYPKLGDAAVGLKPIPFYIDDTAGVTPLQVRAKCRRMAARVGLDMIVVDNIQRMHADSGTRDLRERAAEVSEALKEIAKEFSVPVLAVSHIRRLKDGEGAEPTIADLQESGNIEQNADVILLMHRLDLYKKVDPSDKGRTKLSFGKNREGPLGFTELFFDEGLVTFCDWDKRIQQFHREEWLP